MGSSESSERRMKAMWWKLAGVWITTALILCSLVLLPVQTHIVKLDMPKGTANPVADQTANVIIGGAGIVVIALLLAILSMPFWLSWRIIRKHRESN